VVRLPCEEPLESRCHGGAEAGAHHVISGMQVRDPADLSRTAHRPSAMRILLAIMLPL
jgi:hypothetical protein